MGLSIAPTSPRPHGRDGSLVLLIALDGGALIFVSCCLKKEFCSMRKHRAIALVLGLAALCGLLASEARAAATISMTITLGNGDTIDVDTFRTGGSATDYGVVNLALLNSTLASDGSAYTFTAFGGGSNNAGTSTQGQLTMTGGIEILSTNTNTDTALTINETEGSFTAPSGKTGTLQSASSATFANQAAGPGQTATSDYNTITTSPYSVNSKGVNDTSGEGNQTSTSIPAWVTPYSLSNSLSFSLVPQTGLDVTDQYGLTATVNTLAIAAVPEPSSVVLVLSSMPVGIGLAGYLRRRQRAATAV